MKTPFNFLFSKHLFTLVFCCLSFSLFSQKELRWNSPTLGSTLHSLDSILETNPQKYLQLIDSLKGTIHEKDKDLFTIKYHFKKGCAHRNLNDFENLYFHFEKMKLYAIEYGYRQLLAEAYREMGDEYLDRGMYKKAVESYDKGKENYAEFGNKDGVLRCSYEGFIENLQGDYEKSNEVLKENLERYKKSNPIYLMALSTIADNYVTLKNIDSAYAYVNKMTFKTGDDINNYNYQYHYNGIATTYFIEKNNIEKAIYYNNLLDEFRITYQDSKSFFENKVAIAKLTNDVKTQLIYIDSLKIIADKHIFSLETKKVIDTETLYTTENKVIVQQDTIFKNTLFLIGLLIVFVISIVLGVKKYVAYKTAQEKLIVKMQQELQSVLLEVNIQAQNKDNENIIGSISDKIKHLTTKYNLTDRESDVLLHITKGLNNQEIADELFVSINTIKYHTRNLYEKLNVKKRAEVSSKLMYDD